MEIYATSTEVYNFCLLSKAVSEPHLKPHLMYMKVLNGQKMFAWYRTEFWKIDTILHSDLINFMPICV